MGHTNHCIRVLPIMKDGKSTRRYRLTGVDAAGKVYSLCPHNSHTHRDEAWACAEAEAAIARLG